MPEHTYSSHEPLSMPDIVSRAESAIDVGIETTFHPRITESHLAHIAFGSDTTLADSHLFTEAVDADPRVSRVNDDEYKIIGRNTEINIDMTALSSVAQDIVAALQSDQKGEFVSKKDIVAFSEALGHFFIKEELLLLFATIAAHPYTEKLDDDWFRIIEPKK